MTELQKAQEALDKLQKEKNELQRIVEGLKKKEKEKKLPNTLDALLELSKGLHFVTVNGDVRSSLVPNILCSKTEKLARNVFLYTQLKNIEYVINEHFESFRIIDDYSYTTSLHKNKVIPNGILIDHCLSSFNFSKSVARDYFMKICEPLLLEYYQTL